MKTAVILFGNIRQVVLTPENESEERALEQFNTNDKIEIAMNYTHSGFEPEHKGVDMCRGGFLTMFQDTKSLILVLSPAEPPQPIEVPTPTYTLDDMQSAFEQSRLTHPMSGFKHDSFDEFMKWYNK